jgi:hypothetical protein
MNKKDLSINVSDSIAVTEAISYTSHLSPGIYREEFERYRSLIQDGDGGKAYALSYILLQIYVENHIHYFLRFLIGDGFSHAPVSCWKVKDYVDKKLQCFRSVLDQHGIQYTPTLFDAIDTNFRYLSDIRNLLAHGHPVTAMYDGGAVSISEAKAYLEPKRFMDTLNKANLVVDAWNTLIDEVGQQTVLLQSAGLPTQSFFNDCKFTARL